MSLPFIALLLQVSTFDFDNVKACSRRRAEMRIFSGKWKNVLDLFLKIYWCDRFSCCHFSWFMHFRRWSLNTSNGWFLVVTAFTCVSLRQSDINLAWPLSFHRCKAIHFHYLFFLYLPHCFLMISNWTWQVYSYTTSLIYSRAKLSFNITTSANCKSTKINPAVLLCWKKTQNIRQLHGPGNTNEFT